MRLKSIKINGLFGMFNHTIQLNTKDRITILHGPNGVGKTTALKLISDLFSMNFTSVNNVPFKNIIIEFFGTTKTLEVYREDSQKKRSGISLKIVAKTSKQRIEHELPISKNINEYLRKRLPPGIIEEYVPFLRRVSFESWRDMRTGDRLELNEVFLKFGDQLPSEYKFSTKEIPKIISTWLDSIPVHFIQTQRLFALSDIDESDYRHRKRAAITTVEKYSIDMADRIQNTLKQSGVLSASLDRTFPHRLLESSIPESATEKNIRDQYDKQASYRSRLMKAGLLEAEAPIPLTSTGLDSNSRKVLWHYMSDVEKKFKVFDDLLMKLELFKDIINKRFQYKRFEVDKNSGFLFYTLDSEQIPLTALSSGEQHELVLAYELIFKVRPNSLILIDEPELSLHITWQHRFLSDIERISELVNLDFLVATHSPSIIHDRSDLMISLGEDK